MAKNFFAEKKPWSFYKDRILGSYLKPFLPKVNTLRAPILVVDCCAGPGKFEDGNEGSPLIIASLLQDFSGRHEKAEVLGIFIEKDVEYFGQLKENLKPFEDIAVCIHARYQGSLARLREAAAEASVFLYVDPFTVRELPIEELSSVFQMVQRGSCVEFLMNFGAGGAVRWGRSILKQQEVLSEQEEDEEFEELGEELDASHCRLDSVLGGDWWQELLLEGGLLRDMQLALCECYKAKLRAFMPFVGGVPIKERHEHVPKYHMIFGTRNVHGLSLMNDVMARTNQKAVDDEFEEGFLFDTAPVYARPGTADLLEPLERIIQRDPGLRRDEVFTKFLAQDDCIAFAMYPDKVLRAAFKELEDSKVILRRPAGANLGEARFFITCDGKLPS